MLRSGSYRVDLGNAFFARVRTEGHAGWYKATCAVLIDNRRYGNKQFFFRQTVNLFDAEFPGRTVVKVIADQFSVDIGTADVTCVMDTQINVANAVKNIRRKHDYHFIRANLCYL